MAKQRIGILGGTFDPVHCGHIHIARLAMESAGLDQVLLLPARAPKYKQCSASAEDRWMMTVAACRGDEKLIPCRLELNMESSTYTADTLPLICGMYPGAKLFWIIGGDALLRVRQWVRAEDVLKQCSLLALNRPCEIDEAVLFTEAESIREMGGRVKIISAEASPFSSSAVRSALAEGREPEGLDLCVREIIECKGLYGRPARIPEAAEWLDRLFASLRPHRFAHSLAVASAAREMAARFGEDPLKAEKAGLLHDCAKHMPLAEMQRIAAENHLDADPDFLLSLRCFTLWSAPG